MIRKLLTVFACGVFLSSCTIYHTVDVTGNPIGSKTGVSKKPFSKNDEAFGAAEAAREGNVDEVGAVEVKIKNYLLWNRVITKVYGE